MDEQKKDEQQTEDLELNDEQAEDVKGGWSWGASQGLTADEKSLNFTRGTVERPGMETQHNETLIRI